MKTNKFYISLAVIFTVMGLNANAQTCGVYKTYEDYTNGKMEVSIDCAGFQNHDYCFHIGINCQFRLPLFITKIKK